MAGTLTIDTLKASSGVLAIQNGMTGIAKAWVNFNGTGTVAIRSSFNVSSITDNGTGDYTVNFTTAMANANYCPVMGIGSGNANNIPCVKAASATAAPTLQSTSQLQIITQYITSGGQVDSANIYVAILGS